MKKIIPLFQRNYDGDRLVRNEVVPGAEWVLAGEGFATQKFDGTCCLVRDGKLYKRYDAKVRLANAGDPDGPNGRVCVRDGKSEGYLLLSPLPKGFKPAQDPDPNTGHWPGWVPVGDGPEDRWHREAWAMHGGVSDGSYELCGPKIQGNPEGLDRHVLVPHGGSVLMDFPRTFEGIREQLSKWNIEGVVWWRDLRNPECDKVKIKGKDFGIKRPKA